MTLWLDHLAAIVIGSVTLVVVLVLQHRGQQHAVQETVNQTTQTRSYAFVRDFERDVENMRSEAQTEAALGGGTYVCAVTRNGAGQATSFTFPTLLEPDQGPASPIAHVTYRLEPAGRSVRVSDTDRPLYALVREVDMDTSLVRTGGSGDTLVGFDVGLFARRSSTSALVCPDDLSRVRLDILSAQQGVGRLSADQKSRPLHNIARHGFTFRPVNRAAGS